MKLFASLNRAWINKTKCSFCVAIFIFSYPFSLSADTPELDVSLVVKRNSYDKTHYQINFKGKPRVSQLVTHAINVLPNINVSDYLYNTRFIYWPAAGLYESQSDEIQHLKEKIINELDALKNRHAPHSKHVNAFISLRDFIYHHTFAKRIYVELDIDKYLTNSLADPLINKDVLLILPDEITDVLVIGAVENNAKITVSSDLSVNDYVEKAKLLAFFGPSEVVVTYPEGIQKSHPIAYYNRVFSSLKGGSVIFIPFADLPFQYANLNQDILRLLQHRVL